MAHTFRHDEALPRRKFNYPVFNVDHELPVEHEKKFVDLFMFMPVIFTLNYRHPDDRVVDLAQRLVVPFVGTSIRELLDIDRFERPMQDVEISLVWELFGAQSRIHAGNLTTEITKVAEKTRRNLDLQPIQTQQWRLFLAVEIIRLLAFDDDAIRC
jgi:hypothetical protein